jgi:hypothetical protein
LGDIVAMPAAALDEVAAAGLRVAHDRFSPAAYISTVETLYREL